MSSVFYSTVAGVSGLHRVAPGVTHIAPHSGLGEILKIGKNVAHFIVALWNTDDADITDIDRWFCN